jgi:hypothetical protein
MGVGEGDEINRCPNLDDALTEGLRRDLADVSVGLRMLPACVGEHRAKGQTSAAK